MNTIMTTQPNVPIINVHPLVSLSSGQKRVADEMGNACREFGFFYIRGHGVDAKLQEKLENLSHQFFALPRAEKMKIRMSLGGKAWRGFFPVGDELTSGKPDLKEGLYFGTELTEDDSRVKAGIPLHGRNLFPTGLPAFRETILEYMEALNRLGHHLMRGLSLSLGLDASYFSSHYTSDPLCLFRIFHYPPSDPEIQKISPWGVGEHTDYGVLTILKQDQVGGLQIKSGTLWIDAPYIPDTFICNIGDMLERMTGGLYRSTPHRVLNTSGRGRLSFPFFFDPNFEAQIKPIPAIGDKRPENNASERWDGASVHQFEGTYGDYILNKVSKVFPQLRREVE